MAHEALPDHPPCPVCRRPTTIEEIYTSVRRRTGVYSWRCLVCLSVFTTEPKKEKAE